MSILRGRTRRLLGRWVLGWGVLWSTLVAAAPYTPSSDGEVLAVLPAGAMHASVAARQQATARLDVALPLAQFYITQAKATGDLRFLGYAESALSHWREATPANEPVLVLGATIKQSRHAFGDALAELDQALALRPDDGQAWLTRATVLRVLGRYDEARHACGHLAGAADESVLQLCTQGVQALSGHLRTAYDAVRALGSRSVSYETRAWRYSELGEMAVQLGESADAEHWFREGLQLAPTDTYARAAYADLLLDEHRPGEVMRLLAGFESMEPLLLRIAIAQRQLRVPGLSQSRALLAAAFTVEEQRHEAVHRREQARFLLDVEGEPQAALRAARANWQTQREPADLLILLRAAQAAQQPQAGEAAQQFVQQHRTEDVRLTPYLRRPG